MDPHISVEAIIAARQIISSFIQQPTPLLRSVYLSNRLERAVYLKLENLNLTGSFKIRGAAHALLTAPKDLLKNGVVAASAGNHAQGLAFVAQQLGIQAHVFMPKRTPLIKIEACKELKAHIHLHGEIYDEAYAQAKEFAEKNHCLFIHPYADPKVIAGQGTIALELQEQLPNIGMVVVPIGGGGLISGVGCAFKELNLKTQIIGVQSEAYPAMKLSFESGKHIKQKPIQTIADGVAVKTVHEYNLALVRRFVDKIVTSSDEEIAGAIMELMERNHLLAEGAGAISVAALNNLQQELKQLPEDQNIVCIISGGNIDTNLVRKISTKGLVFSGRLMRLRFTVFDRPGTLAHLLSAIAKTGANINEVIHDHLFGASHYSQIEIDVIMETSGPEHQKNIIESLTKAQFQFKIVNAALI